MPYTQTILPSLKLVYTRVTGVVTAHDMAEMFHSYATHPAAEPGQNFLIDVRDVAASSLSNPERLLLHSQIHPILAIGGKRRKMVVLARHATESRGLKTFVQIWDTTPNIDAKIAFTEWEVAQILEIDDIAIRDLNLCSSNLRFKIEFAS